MAIFGGGPSVGNVSIDVGLRPHPGFNRQLNAIGATAAGRLGAAAGDAGVTSSRRFVDRFRGGIVASDRVINRVAVGIGKTLDGALGAAGLVAGTTLGVSLVTGFQRLADIDDMRHKMEGMGFSAKETEGLISQLDEALWNTTVPLNEASLGMTRLITAGTDVDDVIDRVVLMADAAAFGQVEINEIANIFERITAEGKISGETLRMLAVRGIPALALLADAADMTQEEMRSAISAGEITTERFFELWDKGAQGFGENGIVIAGAADKVTETLRGAAKNVGTFLGRMGAGFLENSKLFDLLHASVNALSDTVEVILPDVDNLGEAFERWARIGDAIEWMEGLPERVERLVDSIRNMSEGAKSLTGAIAGLSAASAVLLLRFMPLFGRMFMGLPGILMRVVALVGGLALANEDLRGALGDLMQALTPLITAIGDNLIDVIIVLIEAALPVLVALLKALLPLVELLAAHADLVAKALIAFVVAVKLARLAIWAKHAAVIATIAAMLVWDKVMKAKAILLKGVAAAQWLLNAAMAANPIGIIIVAVLALVAGFIWLWHNVEGFRNFWIKAWELIKVAAVWVWENALKPAFDGIVTAINDFIIPAVLFMWNNVYQPIFQAIARVTTWVFENIIFPIFDLVRMYFMEILVPAILWFWEHALKPSFENAAAVVSWAWETVIQPVFEALVAFISNVVAPVVLWLWENAFQPAFSGIGTALSWLWDTIMFPVFELVVAAILWVGRIAMQLWEKFFKPAFDALGTALVWLWENVFERAFIGIRIIVENFWDIVGAIFRALVSFIEDNIFPALRFFRDLAVEVWEGITDAISTAWDVISGVFDAWISFIENVLVPVWEGTRDTIVEVWDSVVEGIKSAWDWVIDNVWDPLETTVTETIPGHFSDMKDSVIGFFEDIWDRIKEIWDNITDLLDAPLDFAGSILDSIPGSSIIPGRAAGGMVNGPGTATSDSILTRLSDGEFVQRASAVDHYGPEFMTALNNRRIPKEALEGFARGGSLSDTEKRKVLLQLHAFPYYTRESFTSQEWDILTTQGFRAYMRYFEKAHGPSPVDLSVERSRVMGAMERYRIWDPNVTNLSQKEFLATRDFERSYGDFPGRQKAWNEYLAMIGRGPSQLRDISFGAPKEQGFVPKFAGGGLARISNGEFVLGADAVKHYGTDVLNAINKEMLPGFQGGGAVGQGQPQPGQTATPSQPGLAGAPGVLEIAIVVSFDNDALEEVLKRLGEGFEEFTTLILSHIDPFALFSEQVLELMVQTSEGLAEIWEQIWEQSIEGWAAFLENIVEEVAEFFDGVIEKFEELHSEIDGFFETLWESILENWDRFGGEFIDNLMEFSIVVVEIFDLTWSEAHGSWADFANQFVQDLLTLENFTVEVLMDMGFSVIEIFDITWSTLQDIFNNFTSQFSSELDAFASNLERTIDNTADNVTSSWDSLWNDVESTFNTFANSHEIRWSEWLTSLRNDWSEFSTDQTRDFDTWQTNELNRFNGFANDMEARWSGMWDDFDASWTSFRPTVDDDIPTSFDRFRSGSINTFQETAEGIGNEWSRTEEFTRAPVAFIIDTVFNSALRNLFNAAGNMFSDMPTFRRASLPSGFGGLRAAKGGIYPGYTPGKDIGLAAVSGGEAIMRPEWTRAVGPGQIHEWNQTARTRGVPGVREELFGHEFVGGFFTGGIVSQINSQTAAVARAARDLEAGQLFESSSLATAADSLEKGIDRIPDDDIRHIGRRAGVSLWDFFLERLVGMDVPMGLGGGRDAGVGSSALLQAMAGFVRQAAPGMTVSSGYRPGDWGYHGRSRAIDMIFSDGSQNRNANQSPIGQAARAAAAITSSFMGQTLELIFDPLKSRGIWNGGFHRFSGPTAGPGTHNDHIHWAFGGSAADIESGGAPDTSIWQGGDLPGFSIYTASPFGELKDATGLFDKAKQAAQFGGMSTAGLSSSDMEALSADQGWLPGFATHYHPGDSEGSTGNTASGRRWDANTIAMRHIPMGSRIGLRHQGNTESGTVWDLGPADWVQARRPNTAYVDLATPLMQSLTGGSANTNILWKILQLGNGRTYRGFRPRGYDEGGLLEPGVTTATNRTSTPEAVLTGAQWNTMADLSKRPIEIKAKFFLDGEEIDARIEASQDGHDNQLVRFLRG